MWLCLCLYVAQFSGSNDVKRSCILVYITCFDIKIALHLYMKQLTSMKTIRLHSSCPLIQPTFSFKPHLRSQISLCGGTHARVGRKTCSEKATNWTRFNFSHSECYDIITIKSQSVNSFAQNIDIFTQCHSDIPTQSHTYTRQIHILQLWLGWPAPECRMNDKRTTYNVNVPKVWN